MKSTKEILKESRMKTPQFFKNDKGQIAHLSGRNKTGRFSFRVDGKRMEFANEDELNKFIQNNNFSRMNPDARVFAKFFK